MGYSSWGHKESDMTEGTEQARMHIWLGWGTRCHQGQRGLADRHVGCAQAPELQHQDKKLVQCSITNFPWVYRASLVAQL